MDCHKHVLSLLVLFCCKIQTSGAQNVSEVSEPAASGSTANTINVTLSSSLHEIDARFLSVALGSAYVTTNYIGSEKLINLASALAPVELRLGGTPANFLTYVPATSERSAEEQSASHDGYELDEAKERSTRRAGPFSVSASQWLAFNAFLKKVNWDLLFDVNHFKKTSSGAWDPTNFEQLLNDSSANGIPITHFQLGNEPSGYNYKYGFRIEAPTLVANLKTMKSILSKYPLYASSKICGPDVSNIRGTNSAYHYLYVFLEAAAYDVIDEICLHQYNLDGKHTNINQFVSAAKMDELKAMYNHVGPMINGTPRPRPIQLTETASANGGGAQGISDAYAAGFLWLDKLGVSATMKATRIFRQALVGASYGLLTWGFNPNPDYYLSLLYKILVEGPVFQVELGIQNDQLRVYANCASRRRYAAGALVVYYMNLADKEAVLSLSQFPDANIDLYLLSPGDENGLYSKYVKLNGNKLLMSGDQLPTLTAKPHNGDVTVAGKTFGFIVVPEAKVPFCVNYFDHLDSNSQGK